MSITQQEFENKVWTMHPSKIINVDYDPIKNVHIVYSFISHQSYFSLRFNAASHVWENGSVVKDNDGLFGILIAPPTLSNSGIYAYNMVAGGSSGNRGSSFDSSISFDLEKWSKPTCECGKEKHGFAKHSDWCDIKE